MLHLILARHGNTFAPGDQVVWVGAKQDLPLVESGLLQAEKLALALQHALIQPTAIYCGPLLRTRKYAEIIGEKLEIDRLPLIDNRLNELDYGEWGGLSEDTLIAKYGQDTLENWSKNGLWPINCNWGSSEEDITEEVRSLAKEIVRDYPSQPSHTILIVSSNGRLRYFLKLVTGAYEQLSKKQSLKVGTGKVCRIDYDGSDYRLINWNIDPKDALWK